LKANRHILVSKSIDPGAFNTGLTGSTCTALPRSARLLEDNEDSALGVAAHVHIESKTLILKAVFYLLVSSAETMGAFNTGFDTPSLDRPTSAIPASHSSSSPFSSVLPA
jgi:hypothetical protein